MRQISLFLQVILVHLSYIYCQQFTFNGNVPPVPPRFLVPGAYSPPVNGPPPARQRLLQGGAEDESVQRLRKPIGRTRPGTAPPASLVAYEPEHFASTPRIPLPQPVVESSSVPSRPVVEEDEEDDTEDSNAAPISTFEPSINTATQRTLRPVTQFRPTRPPYFANTNIIDEEERGGGSGGNNEFQTTKAQPSYEVSQLPTTIEGNTASFRRTSPPEIPRKQFTQRTQNFRPYSLPPQPQQQPQPQPQEIVENKISRTYEKPAKTKFEKSTNPEKRTKKPVAQVLRRYREDNPDGSITWGFENDDGSYKEETIGNDCVTRGKYGYIDPDGMRREYSYSQGQPCDKNKEDQSEDGNSPSGGYVDYSSNKVVLPNGDSVDLNNMVKNRARKPTKFKNS